MNSRMSRSRWAVVAAIVAGIAVFAACGGKRDATDSAVGGPPRSSAPADQSGLASNYAPADGAARDEASKSAARAPASTTDTGASGGSAGAAASATLLDRKLVRTAIVQVETDAVSQKFEEVGNIAAGAGGLVFSSAFGNDGEQQTASITVRVPGDRYQDVLVQLRKLGEVKSEQSNASDVTAEYTDLGAQLANLQASEREYLKLLARAETIDEILTVQDRVNGIRGQIDQTQGRINLLNNQTDLATITVHLTPPVAGKTKTDDGGTSSPLEAAQAAFDASLAVLVGIATVALAVGAFSWWLLPLIAIAWYFGRRQMRADRERRQSPPPVA